MGLKNDAKSAPKTRLEFKTSFKLKKSLILLSLTRPNLEKTLEKQWFLQVFGFSMFFALTFNFDRFLMDFEFQNRAKIDQKSKLEAQ